MTKIPNKNTGNIKIILVVNVWHLVLDIWNLFEI